MFLVTSVVPDELTIFLYNPFVHHQLVQAVVATSNELTANLPVEPPPLASTVVEKAGQA